MTESVLRFVVSCALLASPVMSATTGGQAQAGATRTVFASVVAKDGTPVTDLTAADFEVKEAGKVQTIASVKLATMPLRVHIIVSDGGSGAFQLGMLRLAQALIVRAEFAFTSVLVQPQRVLDFTDDGELIGDGLKKLGNRGTGRGGNQVMEAIRDALKDIAAPGKHPVLIVLRIGNEDASPVSATTLREALRMSDATMYVVSRAGASKAAATYAGVNSMSAEAAQRQMDDSELADTSLQLNLVLGDGSRDSGGSSQETALTSAVPTLERLAAEINGQYAITYTLPADVKPSDRVQITTTRKNVTLRAALRLPN